MSLLLLFNQNIPGAGPLTKAINSADWTGIVQRLASDPQALASITEQIDKLEELLAETKLTNAERVQAGAAIDALKSLVHAPQPEWKAIVVILSGDTVTALCNITQIAIVVGTIITLILG